MVFTHPPPPTPILLDAKEDPNGIRKYPVGSYKTIRITSVCVGWGSTELGHKDVYTADWEVSRTTRHQQTWHAPRILTPNLMSAFVTLWKQTHEKDLLIPSAFFTFPKGVLQKNRRRQLPLGNQGPKIRELYERVRVLVEKVTGISFKALEPESDLLAHVLEYRMHSNGAMENVGHHYDIGGQLQESCDEFTTTLTLEGAGCVHFPDLSSSDVPFSVFCQPGDMFVHENNAKSLHFTTNLPPRRLIASLHFFRNQPMHACNTLLDTAEEGKVHGEPAQKYLPDGEEAV